MLAQITPAVTPTDWVGIGKMLIEILGALAVAYTAWKSKQTGNTVDVVHQLTNSAMGEQLHTGMVSAKTLAAASPSAENNVLSQIAEDKYTAHVADQAKVDAGVKAP